MASDPIEGQVLLLAAAKASVASTRLPDLVERAQAAVDADRERYRRAHECVHEDGERAAFLVERGHWEGVGERVGLSPREVAAVRRTHEEQLLRIGRREGRADEFEAALDIREPVIVSA